MAISGLFNIGNFSNLQNLKKDIEEKKQERTKIYNYIGLEAYDLYTQGKLTCPELEIYFEKLDDIEKVMLELEKEKKDLEEQSKKNITCSCGAVIPAKDKFCGKCGKPIEQKNNICSCGKKIEEGLSFCPNCGKSTVWVNENIQETNMFKECLCGAKVPQEQNMCMECGRQIK